MILTGQEAREFSQKEKEIKSRLQKQVSNIDIRYGIIILKSFFTGINKPRKVEALKIRNQYWELQTQVFKEDNTLNYEFGGGSYYLGEVLRRKIYQRRRKVEKKYDLKPLDIHSPWE